MEIYDENENICILYLVFGKFDNFLNIIIWRYFYVVYKVKF